MAQYELKKRDGGYHVIGLRDAWMDTPHTCLMVRYPAGDVDLVTGRGKSLYEKLHRALYDLYQTHDGLHEGDIFLLKGKPVFQCCGYHVRALDNRGWVAPYTE